jgi:hypothetical protein
MADLRRSAYLSRRFALGAPAILNFHPAEFADFPSASKNFPAFPKLSSQPAKDTHARRFLDDGTSPGDPALSILFPSMVTNPERTLAPRMERIVRDEGTNPTSKTQM